MPGYQGTAPAFTSAPAPAEVLRALEVVRPRILAVTMLDDASTIALRRAARWAEVFRATLHVLYVLPAAASSSGGFQGVNSGQPLDRNQHALMSTKSWVEQGLGFALPDAQLHLVDGDLETQIATVADTIDASFIVLGEDHHKTTSVLLPRVATQLVRKYQRPVLIARSEELAQHLLAATDLTDPAYPTLAYASSLARRTGAQMAFLHHVEHASSAFMMGHEFAAKGSLNGCDLPTLATQVAEEHLDRLTPLFGEPSEVIVTYRGDVTSTIINAAENQHADLIVVGAHDESCTTHHPAGGVSYAVARRAPCSVLVVPLAAN